MRASSRALIALFCWLSFGGFARQSASLAQVTPAGESPAALAPRVDRRTTLDVVVTDRSGNPVPGLHQQDFTVLDGKQPQTIVSFEAVDETSEPAGPPLRAIVLVDAINTPFQGLAFERQELDRFFHHVGAHLSLPLSLGFLPDSYGGLTAATQDGNVLADSLNSQEFDLHTMNRAQGFYGGIDRRQACLSAFGRLITSEARKPGRKLLIWLGPGWPLLSGPNVELSAKAQATIFRGVVSLSTGLREGRITLYNVDQPAGGDSISRQFNYQDYLKGVGSANKVQDGNLALQVFAVQSGGRVLNASNDLADSIARCLGDAKVFYTLAFDSPAADHPDEYHRLQVKIDKPGLTARTRTGYYAQP